jgi:hypothetical protein
VRPNIQLPSSPLPYISPAGSSPAQIRHAYGFDQISFGSVAANGKGQTIAIVDAGDDPTVAVDLAVFDKTFGLPAPHFTKVDQNGGTHYPPTDTSWALETSLDVQWAHAIAPAANILLVESNTAQFNDMLTAVAYAARQPGVSVISMSWGLWETQVGAFIDLSTIDSYLTTPVHHQGITFVASSGDNGAAEAPEWPAASPNALAVGGTTLLPSDAQGTYSQETGWYGSGGGIATFEGEPAYEKGVQSLGKRTNPGVAYDADPNTGVAVYDSTPYQGSTGWFEVGGTSAGAPQWSALLAIANQGRSLAGKGSLANAQATVYTLSSLDFHDITVGTNGYPADTGYDLVTGIGTPVANNLIYDLVHGYSTVPVPPGVLPVLPFTTRTLKPFSGTGTNAPAPPTPVVGKVPDAPATPPTAETAAPVPFFIGLLGTAGNTGPSAAPASNRTLAPAAPAFVTPAEPARPTDSRVQSGGGQNGLLLGDDTDGLPAFDSPSASRVPAQSAPTAFEAALSQAQPGDGLGRQVQDDYFQAFRLPGTRTEAPASFGPVEPALDSSAAVAGLALFLSGYGPIVTRKSGSDTRQAALIHALGDAA